MIDSGPGADARVGGLFVYPLKGAAGIALRHATLDERGIHLDRRWLLVDDRGRFLTQREVPRLALVRVQLGDTDAASAARVRFTVAGPRAPNAQPSSLEVDAGGEDGSRVDVAIWDDIVEAVDQGDDAAAWFTAVLGVRCRLVRMPDDVVRPVTREYGSDRDRIAFADGFPLLIISGSALDELNRRLDRPLLMNRFRPNIVIDGVPPHAEDGWRAIRIGSIPIDVVKPCARCVVTTVDQATGIPGREPLRTLASYRNRGGKVMFGMNAIHRATGIVSTGDPVALDHD